jgi:hypothetical protein
MPTTRTGGSLRDGDCTIRSLLSMTVPNAKMCQQVTRTRGPQRTNQGGRLSIVGSDKVIVLALTDATPGPRRPIALLGGRLAEMPDPPVPDRDALDDELRSLRAEVARLQAENGRLQKVLGVTGSIVSDRPSQSPLFTGPTGPVTASSSAAEKLRLFRALFAGREDVYAVRWENDRTGKAGWMPAVQGGWKRDKSAPRIYLPLTAQILTEHLTGDIHAGVYPLLDGDTCRFLACDFDGQAALLDSLAYLKAARAADIPAALEASRSGVGAHVWIFFSGPVHATIARRLGAALLREAIAMRGELDLSSYDRRRTSGRTRGPAASSTRVSETRGVAA